MAASPRGIVWTPLLLCHAVTVVVLIVLDRVLGSDVVSLLLVLTGIPWSAFALSTGGTTFAAVLYGSALVNLLAHVWWLRNEDRFSE